MALKIKLDRVSKDDIDAAKAEAATSQRYTGPTPTPDTYKAKIGGIWLKESSKGDPMVVVAFRLTDNKGDKEVYNGASIFNNYMVPQDSSHQYFHIQVSTMEAMLQAASKGTFGFSEFVDAANTDRIVTGQAQGRAGEPINQIGKLKFPSESTFEIRTKMNTYQGKENPAIHYILDDSWESAGQPSDVDDDVAGLDEPVDEAPVADDLDDLLEA